MPSPITRRVSKATGKVSWTVQIRIGSRDYVTCLTCRLCAQKDRQVIVGFLPHGSDIANATS